MGSSNVYADDCHQVMQNASCVHKLLFKIFFDLLEIKDLVI